MPKTHFPVQLIISTVHKLLESHVNRVPDFYKVPKTHFPEQLIISTVHELLKYNVHTVQELYDVRV